MLSRNNYKYIYDAKFANYLIINGVQCKGTGISRETGKVFWCFDYNDVQPYYKSSN